MNKKKRIRLEFTAIENGQITEWHLDKKLLMLRQMLAERVGGEGLYVFHQWLLTTTENPNYLVAVKGGKVRR